MTRPPLTGSYGRLTISERVDDDRAGARCYRCTCRCGAVVTVRGANLTAGYTQSCGCLRRDVQRTRPRVT